MVATVMPHCFCHCLKLPYVPGCWYSCQYPSGRVSTLGRCWDPVSIARRWSSGCGSITLLFIVHCSNGMRPSSTSSPAPATSSVFSHTLSSRNLPIVGQKNLTSSYPLPWCSFMRSIMVCLLFCSNLETT